MATPPRRQFGDLSKSARDRAARAGREYGLNRRQVRERYNRGTFNPLARKDSPLRVPAELRREAVITESGEISVDWEALALTNMQNRLGDYFKWNMFAVVENISHSTPAVLYAMAMATEDELMQFAFVQSPDEDAQLPYGLTPRDIFYQDDNGKWINPFWYH